MWLQLSKSLQAYGKQVGQLARRYETGESWMVLLAILVGLLAGIAAALLKYMIGGVSHLLTDRLHSIGPNYLLLLLPVVGIFLAVLYQRFLLRKDIYHGVVRLNNMLANNNYSLPAGRIISPLIASTLTLGFGGSAGSEGPIAYTGASIGSTIGRRFGVSTDTMKILVAAGAAAGIAGIFKAPVGGALFALEVLTVELNTVAVVCVFAAAMVAGLTAFALSNFSADIIFYTPFDFDWHLMPLIVAAGAFYGLYSTYYAVVMSKMTMWYQRRERRWLKALISGGIIGLAVFFFPTLYGEGYNFMSQVLNNGADAVASYSLFATDTPTPTLMLLMFGGLMLAKCWVTASTTSGGGVAGDFAPSLFAGCITGFFFALAVNTLFHTDLHLAYFAFFGMAGVMAATQRAPLMAIFLTVEMGQAYHLILPVTTAALTSYLVCRGMARLLRLTNI